ncbi:MAG: AAA family ATPase [Planctomyces sp.]|nr:AAA family ATPase [Planctomyces sp.]
MPLRNPGPPAESPSARTSSPAAAAAASDHEAAESSACEYVNSGRGGVVRRRRVETPEAIRGHEHLAALFERVNSLLGDAVGEQEEGFRPRVPQTLQESGLTEEDVQRLVLKYLMQKGSGSGREIAIQIKLPFGLVDPLLRQWKHEQLVAFKSAAEMGDYIFTITDVGRERARRYTEECTYFGAAPVSLRDYLRSMEAQSVAGLEVTEAALKRAFNDLLVPEDLMEQLGPAINSGRGMFLFGEAGNGKTSIAERVTRCFGDTIWIPRALGIDGEIIRLFDPGVHEEVETPTTDGLFDLSGVDPRWVRVVRPTVVAGGELTMSELEVTQNPQTKICESPLQLKSNGGTLVIDDFGRQTMPVNVLLNRWIVPLEKRYDFLNLPSGKKIQVPFDQLIIFSTNLEPKNLVDGAFLRRIPYKIKVPDPSPAFYRRLCEILAPKLGLIHDPDAVDYLLETHYAAVGRPLRSCQPRDLLLQVRNYCTYKQIPKRVTRESFDYAVANYFSVM